LLEAIKQEARARGCCRLTLVNLKDRTSYQRRFYEKKGWSERPDAVRFVLNLEVKA
jgi:GNAT superfamily N-acetyltransferase